MTSPSAAVTSAATPAPFTADVAASAHVAPAPESPASSRHIPPLDGLRGIAILLVLFHHYTREPVTALRIDWAFWRITKTGWTGVDLFFVLSGFLITGLLIDGKRSGGALRNFYIRRALRIVPLYYAFLAVVLVLQPHLHPIDAEKMPQLVRHQLWFWTYTSNILMAHRAVWDLVPPWTVHLWSLAVEEQFYLVWPLVVLATSPRQLRVACVAAIAASLTMRIVWWAMSPNPVATYMLTPARFDALAMGGLLASLAREPGGLVRLVPAAQVTLGVAGTLLVALFAALRPSYEATQPMQTVGFTLLALFFGAALVLAVTARPGGRPWRALSGGLLATFGRYSYAIYVLHLTVIYIVAGHGLADDALPRLFGSQIPGMLFLVAVCATISLALAWLSWQLLERRFLQRKDRFPYPVPAPRSGSAGGAGRLPQRRSAA